MAALTVSLFQIVYGLIAYAFLAVVLVAISWTDWQTRRIPNKFIGALCLLRLIVFVLDSWWGQADRACSMLANSVAVSVGFSAFLLVIKIVLERITGKESLGGGDVKLVAAGYLFLSFDQALVALSVSSVVGVVLALCFLIFKKDKSFPFGPALCLGIMVGLFA